MTVAVIGHGRSPEGKRWGNRINTCSTVIRMWDWNWQVPMHEDFGLKYNYGLFVLTPKQFGAFTRQNMHTPDEGWLAYFGKPTSAELPPKTIKVDAGPWVTLGLELGGAGLGGTLTLTRGAVAALWAICNMALSRRVVLVGFDNVKKGVNQSIEDSFHPDYWKQFNSKFENAPEKYYPIGSAKTATHDMSVELPLLRQVASIYGVTLEFAEDVWSG
jgi:hypothetical protein